MTRPLQSGEHPVVLAAFEPFGGRRRNRSWELLRSLDTPCARVQLPVDFARLADAVRPLVAMGPRALLLLGEAPIETVRVEQIALNVMDSERPDNAGRKPRAELLIPDAPLALAASWNARALAEQLRQQRIPAAPSFHAGTYACNASLYFALHAAQGVVPVGFLHIPHRRWPRGLRLGKLQRAVELCARDLEGARAAPAAPAEEEARHDG